ncbi:hypothetical protein [Devosia sp. A369]
MSAWAKPGVKCVCIESNDPNTIVPKHMWPMVNEVYTVHELWIDEAGDPFPVLEELDPNLVCTPDFFRPLITKTQEQDVALFRHILDGIPVEEDA